MPIYDLRCPVCNAETTAFGDEPPPDGLFACHVDGCDGRMKRVWSKVSVGRGTSGLTPPR